MKQSLIKKCAAFAATLIAGAAVVGGGAVNNVSAYTTVNGEKQYSIAADRVIYRTDAPFDRTINTFEAWIRLPEEIADDAEGGVIFGNYFNLPTGYPGGVDFGVGAGGKFELYWNFGTGPTNKGDKYNVQLHKRFENTDLRTGEWTHVALVRDKAKSSLDYYVNGTLDESMNVTLSESVCDMVFGIGSDWNNWFADKTPFMGEIRQITLYSEAVEADTVAADMVDTEITVEQRPGCGLMANWSFPGLWGSEKVIADSSGNGNTCSRATVDKYVPAEFASDYDYSFVVVPDMQAMTYHKPQNFSDQSDWIVNNAEKLNIKFAMYLGDMTESRYSTAPEKSEEEWKIASAAIKKLDGKVPYSFVLGNHDYDNWSTQSRDTTMFDKYFSYDVYCKTATFGGAFEDGDMANTYHIFRVGGIKYLVFALEYGPRTTVLNWVDRITAEHPDCRVIVTSHSIVAPSGHFVTNTDPSNPTHAITYGSANTGVDMWNKTLKKRDNMFMTFSGHLCTDDVVMRSDVGENGNTVRSVLVNAQGAMLTSAMNTLLVVQVNERTKKMHFCYYSPEYDACYNEQSQYSFSFADENNPTVGEAVQQEDDEPSGECIVTIDYGNGTTETRRVQKGKTIAEPAAPKFCNHTFAGWYSGGAEYDWNEPVQSDITVTALWERRYAGGLTNVHGGFDEKNGVYTARNVNSLAVNTTDGFNCGSIEVTVTTAVPGDNGIVFGLTGKGETYWEGVGVQYYFFFVGRNGDKPVAYLGKTDNGKWSALKVVGISGLASATPYTLKVAVSGTDIRCYVNGKLYIVYSENNFLTGTGYGIRAGSVATVFENITVN